MLTGKNEGMNNPKAHIDHNALPHILVVDDDDRIRDLVSRYLSENGFFVVGASDAQEAKEILDFAEFDALVVDVMMPGQSGVDFTQEIREMNNALQDVPVLLLTAMGETEDRITGLSAGADDYLAKPFDPRELVLRLEAILRRRPQTQASKIKIGQWIFEQEQNILISANNNQDVVKLTDVEVTLLTSLSGSMGRVMSREELSELCGLDPEKRTVDVQVTRLRRKIEEDSNMPRYLQTVRGKGYVLKAERL